MAMIVSRFNEYSVLTQGGTGSELCDQLNKFISKSNSLSLLSNQSTKHSFSLIEVVMSLGIVSFAMMGILSLLPLGLHTFRESINTTSQAQIVEQLLSEALLTDYSSLKNFSTNYDEGGRGVLSSDPRRIFTVNVVLTNIPNSVTTNFPPTVATNLIITVWNKTHPAQTNYYSTVVVKNY